MHIFLSGIGGSGMSSMALLAKQAGYDVSGSDARDSGTIAYLKAHGINHIHIGQSAEQIDKVHKAQPIDWFVYTSALPKEHVELKYCQAHNIKSTKRDEFLNHLISDKGLELFAVAGTHGKSTTTAMAIWLFNQRGVPASYCIGAKLGFAEAGAYQKNSSYFIYETDEFDRNFLSFYPKLALISGLDWDHPDIYPTRQSYEDAFREFIGQSEQVFLWHDDAERLGLEASENLAIFDSHNPAIDNSKLIGRVNRLDAWLVANAFSGVLDKAPDALFKELDGFPGLARRFEKLAENIYSDYAHTPAKIRGALQTANELAGDNVVVVYEGLHNLRQHFIKEELAELFTNVKQLYIVPSYLARENPSLEILTPDKILDLLSNESRRHAKTAQLDEKLLNSIRQHAKAGDLVLCFSAGGASSLDEWLRTQL